MTVTTDRRDAILRAVALTGEHLLRKGSLDDQLDEALAALGAATGVDRVYVFRVARTDHGLRTSQTHEWAAPGVEPQIDNPELQDLAFADIGFARWADVLAAGGTIDGPVDSFPPSEHELLRAQQIRALAAVPVMVDGSWWGFIGFDLTCDERPFTEAEVAALRTAAGIVGAAIAQRAAWARLERQRARLANALVAEREAVARLEELDQLKTRFIDAVSHELRTPLTAVLGLASTLRSAPLDEELRQRMLERLDDNAHRLDAVLAKLLDLHELRAASLEPVPEPTDVGALLHDAVTMHVVAAERTVTVDAAGTAEVDPGLLRRVVNHLLDNARVHSDEGNRVWVTTRCTPEGLVLTVADDGRGVAAEHRERVFEPFSHGDMLRPHAPGTGVGLSVVAGLARLHGGRAWCDERAGGGAAFHVLLGASPAAA